MAFDTGWSSLGAFGRTFRDVLGASPGGFRAQADGACPARRRTPPCFQSAADRPGLTVAVSEKRRRAAAAS